MKVIAINGSPRKNGNTYFALQTVIAELEKEGIETELIHVGNKKIGGCLSCNYCIKSQNKRCVTDDIVNECIPKIAAADGLLLGSPVHWAGMGGTLKAFLDRLFYVATANGGLFRHKVGASVAAVRRTGGIPAIEQMNKFLDYMEMFIPTSNYWNVIHGAVPVEAEQDYEGVQIMRVLGKNMAWLMKTIELGKKHIPLPEQEAKTYTNFIR